MACVAFKCVGTVAADKDIVACAAKQCVRACAARDHIVTAVAKDRVVVAICTVNGVTLCIDKTRQHNVVIVCAVYWVVSRFFFIDRHIVDGPFEKLVVVTIVAFACTKGEIFIIVVADIHCQTRCGDVHRLRRARGQVLNLERHACLLIPRVFDVNEVTRRHEASIC